MSKLIYIDNENKNLELLEEAIIQADLGTNFPVIDVINSNDATTSEEHIENICRFIGELSEGLKYEKIKLLMDAAFLLRKFINN